MKKYAILLTGAIMATSTLPVAAETIENTEVQYSIDTNVDVAQDDVESFLTYARSEKLKNDKVKTVGNGDFQFILMSDDNELSYVYQNIDGVENVLVVENEESVTDLKATRAGAFSDGIGGRAYMQAGNDIACTIKLPSTATVTTGDAYIYGGFVGSTTQSDIGMMYSKTYNVWKPYMKVGSAMGSFLSGYDQVQNLNGYLPGQSITANLYNNYNSTGRSRMKLQGYAKYATSSGTGSNTYLTTIMETSTIVSSPTKTKLLATIAENSDNAVGTYQADFTGITVAGSTPTWGIVDTDYGTVTKGTNSLTIKVSK